MSAVGFVLGEAAARLALGEPQWAPRVPEAGVAGGLDQDAVSSRS